MDKPLWSDAPSWANYLAMDEDGTWFWYENKPTVHFEDYYAWNGGQVEKAKPIKRSWDKTLEVRP